MSMGREASRSAGLPETRDGVVAVATDATSAPATIAPTTKSKKLATPRAWNGAGRKRRITLPIGRRRARPEGAWTDVWARRRDQCSVLPHEPQRPPTGRGPDP